MFISPVLSSLLLAIIPILAYAYPQGSNDRGIITTKVHSRIPKGDASTDSGNTSGTVDIGFGTIQATTTPGLNSENVSGYAISQATNDSGLPSPPDDQSSLDNFVANIPNETHWLELYDFATAVPTAFTVCRSPLFKGEPSNLQLGVWRPCDLSTYQWQLVNYTNALNFHIKAEHAIRNVTTSQVLLKSVDLPIRFSNATGVINGTRYLSDFWYSSGILHGKYEPAPAGWKGDDALKSLGG